MAGGCSFRDALKLQQDENHRRVAQRKDQRSLTDYEQPEEKTITKPVQPKRGKSHKKGSRTKV
jgi:hypothetical protein